MRRAKIFMINLLSFELKKGKVSIRGENIRK